MDRLYDIYLVGKFYKSKLEDKLKKIKKKKG